MIKSGKLYLSMKNQGQLTSKQPFYILPTIIFAQFAGTSLWFAPNAIMPDLQKALALAPGLLGHITSAVQFGFIFGTLIFAILSIADRFSPSRVFMLCAAIGSLSNLSVYLFANQLGQLLLFRFITGFFLAGIYPVGMKIAADWYGGKLGKALGYLVGALVLGTAFPHILKALSSSISWQSVLIVTSMLALIGGIIMVWLVGNGPYRSPSPRFQWKAIPLIFSHQDFRSAAFGYFGHMWELYTFWAFVPIILTVYARDLPPSSMHWWAGIIIGSGAVGCISGGYLSTKMSSSLVAFGMLLVSGICCILSPFAFTLPFTFLVIFMIIWGFSVVGDSPQFSSVVAQTAPKQYIGTALTIVNSIGFLITIMSIQLLTYLSQWISYDNLFLTLTIGPIIGLIAIFRLIRNNQTA